MKKYTYNELKNSILKLGVKKNESIFIHSSIFELGIMDNVKIEDLSKNIINCFMECIGKKGTLFLPAFFHDYSKKNMKFYLKKSPPSISLGSLSQYVFMNKKFERSKNPLTSIFGMGHDAKYVCNTSNFSSYGINSIWDKLLDINTKFIFLGTNLSNSFTFVHHIEFLYGVPHMYIKQFSHDIINADNKLINNKINAYVRYLDFDIKTNFKKFQIDLIKSKYLCKKKLGSGEISLINSNDAFKFGFSKLELNNNYFLNNSPTFKKNKLPLI